jgi:hypothetical protein
MWTRGSLRPYQPHAIRPWHMHLTNGERGRLIGSYPGYGAGLIRGGFQPIEPGLNRGREIAPGFGVAMDPSDPSTWTRPVRVT